MDKHAVARVLDTIASCLELKGENPFKVRAYTTAARALLDFPGDADAALASGELAAVKGIGPATLEVIREVAHTGRSSALEALEREVPPGLRDMLRISGFGATKIRAVHAALGVATLDALEAAARDGRLAALPRFGEKTAAKILRGIEFVRRTSAWKLSHHAARDADALARGVGALPGVERVEIAGGVRRRAEVVGELDVVAALAAGADAPPRAPEQPAGRVTFTPPERFVHALLWATGSEPHLERLAARAAARGFTLDSAGLRCASGELVAAPDEATLYAALGLAWIPPELREGGDEIERAADGRLPRLVERRDLAGFLHCHSVYSDGANTVAELAEAARAGGYAWIGITDHSVAAAYAGGMAADDVRAQHEEIAALEPAAGIRILKGIEADILADGSLDYGPELLDRFDFVIGSIHSRMEMDTETMTRRVLTALDDPRLTILGHPTGRLLLARDPYALDMDAVLARAAARGVAIEINGDPHRLDLDWRRCTAAKAAGIPIAIGADAHSLAGFENVDFGVGVARKAGLEKGDILNARTGDEFLAFARSRR